MKQNLNRWNKFELLRKKFFRWNKIELLRQNCEFKKISKLDFLQQRLSKNEWFEYLSRYCYSKILNIPFKDFNTSIQKFECFLAEACTKVSILAQFIFNFHYFVICFLSILSKFIVIVIAFIDSFLINNLINSSKNNMEPRHLVT